MGRSEIEVDQVGFVQEWLAARGIEAPETPVRQAPPADQPAAGVADADADPESVARAIVVRKLAARACTRHELEKALASRSVPAEAAKVVLDRMQELGLIDDERFAADWVASRQQRRHLSARALTRELTARGVAHEQIAEAVADVDVTDEYEAALALARRRAAPLGGQPYEVAYRRLAGVLARRGFGSSVSSRVLREVLARDPDDRDETLLLDE